MRQEAITKDSKLESGYKWGFETDIKSVKIPKGINENTVRLISKLKEEPKWMLDYRLKAYRSWVKKKQPTWAKLRMPEIDFQDIVYYAAPGGQNKPKSIEDLDPEECIDCMACEPECPVEAIFSEDEVPGEWNEYIKKNYEYFGQEAPE